MSRSRLRLQRCRGARLLGLAVLFLEFPVVPRRLSAQQSPPTALAFRGVTVIDVTDGRRLPDQMVTVLGNRIQTITPDADGRVPKGAQVVDARGKYMVPGFWDMHTHTEYPGIENVELQDSVYRTVYPFYVANGVTGIREMAQRWQGGTDSFRVWQREVMDGTRIGPRAIGPSGDFTYGMTLETPDDARRIVDSLKAAGDPFVKFHDDGFQDRDLFFAILREARKVSLPVVGHIPRAVTNVEAADSGMRSIEHNQEHHQCFAWPESLPDSTTLDEICAPVAQAYIRNGTWLVPTMTTHWLDPAPGARSPELWDDTLRFWRMLRRFGVKKFLSGTDWAPQILDQYGREFWPGLSAREELVFLAKIGFSPLEALQMGTLNPAIFLEATDSLGTVAPGKLADLALLDADPIVDIANVLKLWGVVANGRYFDHAALVRMDPEGFKPGNGLVPMDRALKQTANPLPVKSPTP